MEYKAPLRDMRFVLHELFDATGHCELLGNGLDRELIDGVLEEAARYTGGEIAPLNRNSDEEGVTLENGEVRTPQGFVEAYKQYVDNGWASMTGPTEYGGQGFPQLVACNFHEMLMGASLSFRIYSGLTEGAVLALYKHGSDELKNAYLEKLVSGSWSGTMCLTEPQAGTDLALLRTSAEPQADGSYKVSGSKIFISGGEHDMSENIVHLVLARLPDAPAGVKGISLLLVPKFIANADGTPGERNALSCGAIEHKMGIKGAATCVMNFDGATGWIVGEPNQGLGCMFTMMNDARFQVGLQGLGIAEQAYQGSLAYARERLQSRGLAGAQHPDKPADPIIVHPDVRRMLLTQKTLVEGSRMLAAYCARQLDLEHGHPEPSYRKAASKRAALLIPIVKAFFTDMGQQGAGTHRRMARAERRDHRRDGARSPGDRRGVGGFPAVLGLCPVGGPLAAGRGAGTGCAGAGRGGRGVLSGQAGECGFLSAPCATASHGTSRIHPGRRGLSDGSAGKRLRVLS